MNRNSKSNEGNSNSSGNASKTDQSAFNTGSLTSNVSVATNESIKIIAESIGISNLSDEACRDLASDLTFVVKSILNDAQKFARKSRRKKVLSSDIDYSLKARSIEPIYGFQSLDQIPFRCATSTGGNGSGRSIYYTEEQIVDLNDLVTVNNQTVKLPNDFVINAHWLAIEGVQPSLPENPQLISRDQQKKEAIEGPSAINQKDKYQQKLQKRQQGENLVKLRSLIPHDLSIEQQIYFKEITEACVGSDELKREEALNSLKHDPGLHQLLPRIILFISEGVRLNIVQLNMAMLTYLMRMAKSLIENKSIYLEKYLHELLPSIMSCVLSKQVCARPEIDNHCVLREFCANIVGQIVKTYGITIPSLQSRIVKIYLNSIQSDKTTFSTLFGAVAGLSELGNEICESFVFPLIKSIGERLAQILDSTASSQEKLPAEKVKQQITKIVSAILKSKPPQPNEFDYLTTEFGAYFGELIHAQLMKLRSQQVSAAQAQVAAALNKQQSRAMLTPQNNRTHIINQPIASINTGPNQFRNTSVPQNNPIPALTNHTSEFANSPNTQKVVKVVHQTVSYSNNKLHVVSSNPASASSNLLNDDLLSNTDLADINFSTMDAESTMITSNKIDDTNLSSASDSPVINKTESKLENVSYLGTTDLANDEKNESAHNLTNDLTSDSNNTNNMTTSDVNLSDTIEPTGEANIDKQD